MRLKGAEILINLLEKQGIDTIAGIPGGANLPIYNALHKSKIKHILARHEQGAGFIAHGIARSTGKPSVCFATSGPGATNLLTAIADAKLDSVPIIAITGQVPSTMIGTDAFQEVDTYGMTLPVTKHNFLIRDAKELFTIIPEAFRIAQDKRPGPITIDIPKDVQLQEIEFEKWPEEKKEKTQSSLDINEINRIADMINQSQRPLLYIGGGIIHSQSHDLIVDLSKKNSIPVTSTLMGLGSFPPNHDLFLGMLGMHGARYTNYVLKEIDLLLAFGVRFDDRATGKVSEFCKQAKIIHIDIDHSEIDKIKKSDIFLEGDIGEALKRMIPSVFKNDRKEWISHIKKIKTDHPFLMPENKDPFQPINLIKKIAQLAQSDAIITTDVGQHQMWTAQVYPFKKPRTLLTSGGLGTMGFGMPAAIGASLANPDKQIICISGDGSLLMNIQELATIKELNLNIKIIIMNNGYLGLVRQQQEYFYDKIYMASKFEAQPDFAAIGRGFGIKSYSIAETDDPNTVLKEIFSDKDPCVIDIPIHYTENVTPMVPSGAGNDEMIGGDINE